MHCPFVEAPRIGTGAFNALSSPRLQCCPVGQLPLAVIPPAALKQAEKTIIDIAGMVSKGSTMAYRQLVTTKGCSEHYLVAVDAVGTTGVALAGPAAPATRHVPVPSCTLVTFGAHHVGQTGAAPCLIITGHILPRSQDVASAS